MKNYLIAAGYLVAGLINLAPVVGSFSTLRLTQLYAIEIGNADLALLLRHRAVLLGIVGALLISAAFQPAWRGIAAIAGLLSMLSYIVLLQLSGTDNSQLQRVLGADVVAIALLLPAFALHAASAYSEA